MEKMLVFKIDEALHRKVKAEAALRGMSVKAYVLSALREYLEKAPKKA